VTGIGESRWGFKTVFSVTEDELKSSNADLLFEGLDTFATVLLVSFAKPCSFRHFTVLCRMAPKFSSGAKVDILLIYADANNTGLKINSSSIVSPSSRTSRPVKMSWSSTLTVLSLK